MPYNNKKWLNNDKNKDNKSITTSNFYKQKNSTKKMDTEN